MKSLSNKIDDVLRNSNHTAWLNDYKTYGHRSYIYINKDILYELYKDYTLCMNDFMIKDEALNYIISFNKDVGKAISSFYGINYKNELSLLHSVSDVVNSSIAADAIVNNSIAIDTLLNNSMFMTYAVDSSVFMSIIANNSTAMNAVINSEIAINAITNSEIAMNAIVNSEIAMNVIANKPTAMSTLFNSTSIVTSAIANSKIAMNEITKNPKAIVAIAKSTANWNIKKPFIMKLNEVSEYISNVYNILTKSEYFTKKNEFYNSAVSNLNQYCTASYAANGFIACALGVYDKSNGTGTRLKINNDTIKDVIYPNAIYNPSTVSSSNINAIAIPVATFENIKYSQAAITIYIAK